MTELEIKKAKANQKNYFLTDSNGLRLLIRSNGSKVFQFRYTHLKQRKIVTIGSYPQISLLQARKKTLEYKELLANAKDPQARKKEEAIALIRDVDGQVHKVYEKWFEIYSKKVKARSTQRVHSFFNTIFLPYFCKYDRDKNFISSLDINDITHRDIIEIVVKYEKRNGADLASRLFRYIKNVWRYAFNIGLLQNNPLADIVIGEILSPIIKNHYPKITDEAILGELLRCIDSYPNSLMIRSALTFVALIPLRSGNLCRLRWSQIDWEKNILSIPRNEMKTSNKNFPDFKLPLSCQAISVLKETKVFSGWGEWIFHSANNPKKPMVGDSLCKVLRNMGFNDESRGRKQLVHSFRGTFRSLIDTRQNEHNSSFEIKEAVLDHRVGNGVTQAYNHLADYTEQMRPLLQWWADYLDKLKVET